MTSPTTLSAAITNSVLYQLMNIHTAFPGKIVSYEYTTKKAQIQPMVDKKYTDGTTQPMPVLNNVPVIFPFSGGASITFPVSTGDYCLVICCERSIANFLATGNQQAPNDPRKFDLSDAVAIMGLLPFTETSPASSNSEVLISYAGSQIKIDSLGNISITSNGNVTIKTSSTVAIGTPTAELLNILSTLMTLLQGPAVTGAALGGPLNPAFITLLTPLQATLESIRGTIT